MFKIKALKTRSYVYIFSVFALLLFSYHLFVFTFFTSKVIAVEPPLYAGDLIRLSYQTDFIKLKETVNTLPKKHLEASEYSGQKIDVLTIGDSFSNGGGGGLNAYYQDHIASINDFNVLNIKRLPFAGKGIAKTFFALYSSGAIDQIKPRVVLLSMGSRDLVSRFATELDWDYKPRTQEILKALLAMKPMELSAYQLKNIPVVNSANFKLPYYTLGYKFIPCMKMVCRFPLKESLFTVKAKKEILVYKKSLQNVYLSTPENIAKVNANLNRIAEMLKEKGIKFYFMPAVSKYDLYSEFIASNPYHNDQLFELLSPLKKEYTLINTKEILLPSLREGEKDLFYADDTHWSAKASNRIFSQTKF